MPPAEAVSFTAREVLSYLPTGWNLDSGDGAGAGAWDPASRRWVARVLDGAEQPWELAVSAEEAGRHGRLEALSRALDRLYREALG